MVNRFDIYKVKAELKEVAMSDGYLSKEEQRLISVIVKNLEAYTDFLKKAVKDGIIDDEERDELFEKRMRVMEGAYETARDDSNISEDEANLLKQVCHLIMKMEEE